MKTNENNPLSLPLSFKESTDDDLLAAYNNWRTLTVGCDFSDYDPSMGELRVAVGWSCRSEASAWVDNVSFESTYGQNLNFENPAGIAPWDARVAAPGTSSAQIEIRQEGVQPVKVDKGLRSLRASFGYDGSSSASNIEVRQRFLPEQLSADIPTYASIRAMKDETACNGFNIFCLVGGSPGGGSASFGIQQMANEFYTWSTN